MKNPETEANLKLSFHGMKPSVTIRSKVHEYVNKLQRRYNDITTWHVHVNGPVPGTGQFKVTIEARVPGAEIAVGRKPGDINAHSDALVAVRDSFAALERRLKKRRRQQYGEVKVHEGKPQGQIDIIFYDEGYGFVEVTDGRRVYFHRNAVIDDAFEDLEVGDPVELTINSDDSPRGPQATSLRRIRPMRFNPQAT